MWRLVLITCILLQFAVANASLFPEFVGTVSAIETRPFHRAAQYSPGSQCYHWNNNCESYWRVGQATGASMAELMTEWATDAGLSELPPTYHAALAEVSDIIQHNGMIMQRMNAMPAQAQMPTDHLGCCIWKI